MIIIGEQINGTRQAVREAIVARDASFVAGLARSQSDAGADYIDVNVATGGGSVEAEAMEWAVAVVREATDRTPSLDSSDPLVLERGLELCGEQRPFINSVSGEEAKLSAVLPLCARYSCPVIALAMDEAGIPETPRARLDVCRRILERALALGIPPENIFFDPLALPISADCAQARITLDTLGLIKSELAGVRTVIGLSNISFGLPRRPVVNRAMMSVAGYMGLDAAIIDPTDSELTAGAFASEALSGNDRYCRGYMKAFRKGLIAEGANGA